MRKPFTRKLTEYEQARADYGRVIPPAELEDILERSLKQYPNTPLSYSTLVDMKVMKHIQDDIARMEAKCKPRS